MLTDDDVVFIFVSGMGSNNKKSQFLIIWGIKRKNKEN